MEIRKQNEPPITEVKHIVLTVAGVSYRIEEAGNGFLSITKLNTDNTGNIGVYPVSSIEILIK